VKLAAFNPLETLLLASAVLLEIIVEKRPHLALNAALAVCLTCHEQNVWLVL
jgi:hypothetical protein